jgi:hypothetical protein
MRPYGTPRVHGINWPDKADLIEFARASHVGHLRGKGGEFHNSVRNPDAKARTRRIYARRARARGKAACRTTAD